MGESCSISRFVWTKVVAELRAGGVASVVHQLWLLRRSSNHCWNEFADWANSMPLTDPQYRLVASLWELSKEQRLEDIAPRLAGIPDQLCNSFR